MNKYTIKAKVSHVRKEHLDVELDESEIKGIVLDLIKEKFPLLKRDWYISNGKLYEYAYTNHHNGDREYNCVGVPTDDHIRAELKRAQLVELFR